MPSIIPDHDEEDLYFVLCDFGTLGLAYMETDPLQADRDTTLRWLREGQYKNPVRIVQVNISAGTAKDVTEQMLGTRQSQPRYQGRGSIPVQPLSTAATSRKVKGVTSEE